MPQVILPYLTRQFPQDESVEILRFNFRPMATGLPSDFMERDDDGDVMIMEEDEETEAADSNNKTNGFSSFGQGFDNHFSNSFAAAPTPIPQFKASSPIPMRNLEPTPTPFLAQPLGALEAATPANNNNSLKRKNEDAATETSFSKRVEIDATTSALISDTHSDGTNPLPTAAATAQTEGAQDDEDESDDESVHLNMELDSDDDEDADVNVHGE
jgi:hypothetical protein